MKKFLILAAVLLFTGLCFTSPVLAGDDKVFVCHVTSLNFDPFQWEGKVISISENAVYAHCGHDGLYDHDPIGVLNTATSICAGEEGKAWDKCMMKNAVGMPCNRQFRDEGAYHPAVVRLCGVPETP